MAGGQHSSSPCPWPCRSPEVIAARPYTYASDVWSLGCVLYEMAARRPAFESLGLPQLMVRGAARLRRLLLLLLLLLPLLLLVAWRCVLPAANSPPRALGG